MFAAAHMTQARKSNAPTKRKSIQFVNIVAQGGLKTDKEKEKHEKEMSTKYALCPKIHRSSIGRRTLIYTVQKIGNIDRYYYIDKNVFHADFKRFRANIKFDCYEHCYGLVGNQTNFMCVGLANVRLKFCSICYDVDKENEVELYYVDTDDISQHRAVLCHGCIGNLIIKQKNDVETVD